LTLPVLPKCHPLIKMCSFYYNDHLKWDYLNIRLYDSYLEKLFSSKDLLFRTLMFPSITDRHPRLFQRVNDLFTTLLPCDLPLAYGPASPAFHPFSARLEKLFAAARMSCPACVLKNSIKRRLVSVVAYMPHRFESRTLAEENLVTGWEMGNGKGTMGGGRSGDERASKCNGAQLPQDSRGECSSLVATGSRKSGPSAFE